MRPARGCELVKGELYRLRQPLKTLEMLDAYEEGYRRELHIATLETGRKYRAWVYMYQQRLPESRRVV
jgi:gamma-glutamylcyclotransferase (GGCT)/AIG2-like uncharacterized protein YtfP